MPRNPPLPPFLSKRKGAAFHPLFPKRASGDFNLDQNFGTFIILTNLAPDARKAKPRQVIEIP
jgi:hypothetical protein